MPYSGFIFDEKMKKLIKEKDYGHYLDIGCGAGKYAEFITKIINRPYIVGVEESLHYINKFDLKNLYHEIHCIDALEFCKKNLSFTTEMVIIGDCIEHLWKSDGIDLINFLIYRCKQIAIIFPTELVQFGDENSPSEHHVSAWSEKDFSNFDFQHTRNGCMNMITLKGYL